jgi:DNA-binding transcriptional LysR family regulator
MKSIVTAAVTAPSAIAAARLRRLNALGGRRTASRMRPANASRRHAAPSGPTSSKRPTAIRRSLVPAVATLAGTHPAVELRVREHEPPEALALLADDEVDLALVYDYNLAPRAFGRDVVATQLWKALWHLAVPAGDDPAGADASPEVLRRYAEADWIVNSRDTADETAVRALATLSGFVPRSTHRADSLELVQDLIAAGLGIGLLPADEPLREGVQRLRLRNPEAELRSYAVTRRGREAWSPLALVTRSITAHEPSFPTAR